MDIHSDENCIFCKVIKGDIPSFKLVETDKIYAFLDINPLSTGHALVVPKYHGDKLTNVPDEYLMEAIKYCKIIAGAAGHENYNILQNNGALAYQSLPHVHFHIIPKTSAEDGLKAEVAFQPGDMQALEKYCEQLQVLLRTRVAKEGLKSSVNTKAKL